MTPQTFAATLCARGIEIVERGNRLRIWPGRAYPYLTDAERAYFRDHRAELHALVREGLPETTVVWSPEAEAARAAESAVREVAIAAAARDAALKAQNLDLWLVLHGNEPEVIAEALRHRDAEQMKQDLHAREHARRFGVVR